MSALLFTAALLLSADADAGPRHRPPPGRAAVVIGLPGVTVRLGGPWRPEYRPAPRAGYVWVDGHWGAGGWVPGHWRPAVARPGMIWVVGHWRGDVYVDGYWRAASRPGYVWVDGYYDGGAWVAGAWRPTGPAIRSDGSDPSPPPEASVYDPDPGDDRAYDAPTNSGEGTKTAARRAEPGGDGAPEVETYSGGPDVGEAPYEGDELGPYEAYRQDDAPLAVPFGAEDREGAGEAPEDAALDERAGDAERHHGIDF